MKKFKDFCIHQHDIECNQKYDKTKPYSYHLELVVSKVDKFKHLLSDDTDFEYEIAICAAWGHDLIEDARQTYNDIANKKIYPKESYGVVTYHSISKKVADIIYLLTDEKGKNRSERHSDKYFADLKETHLAVFVKLCDVIANVQYSILMESSMYNK
jgi:predicted metal-dependent HD superfamily phosphohydrolase